MMAPKWRPLNYPISRNIIRWGIRPFSIHQGVVFHFESCVWALATLATKVWGEGNIQPKLEEGCVVYQVFCSTYIKEEDFAFFNLIYHFSRQIFTSRPDWPPVVSFDLRPRVTSLISQDEWDDGKDISLIYTLAWSPLNIKRNTNERSI